MNKKIIIPALVFLFGAVGGILRGYELYHGFEYATGLAIAGAGEVAAMRITAGAVVLIFAVLAAFSKNEAADYESRFARRAGSPIMLAGAVLMILAAAADYFLGGGDLPLSRGILMLFVLISGACIMLSLINYKKAESAKLRGVFAVVPVFMCCYALVISYRDLASEPEVEVFLYEMLALAAFAAALYYAASSAFAKDCPRITLFFAASAAVLFLICIGGSVVAAFSYDIRPRDTGMLCYYTAFAVWSIGTVVSLCVKPASAAAGDAENNEQE